MTPNPTGPQTPTLLSSISQACPVVNGEPQKGAQQPTALLPHEVGSIQAILLAGQNPQMRFRLRHSWPAFLVVSILDGSFEAAMRCPPAEDPGAGAKRANSFSSLVRAQLPCK